MKLFSFKEKINILLNTPELKTIFADVAAKLQAAEVKEENMQTHPWGAFVYKIEKLVRSYLSNIKIPKL